MPFSNLSATACTLLTPFVLNRGRFSRFLPFYIDVWRYFPCKCAGTKYEKSVMKITVVGKIVKDESMGGYYIQGKQPPEIFNIVNQNPKVLEKYAKNGKDVTIEAQSAMGDNLVIEKIEGEKYAEAEMK